MKNARLKILAGTFQLTKLPKDAPIPQSVFEQEWYTISRTRDELSIIAPDNLLIDSEYSEKGWRIIQFLESMELSLVGITAKITAILAQRDINLCVVATYNTDYIMIKDEQLYMAVQSLEQAGYVFE